MFDFFAYELDSGVINIFATHYSSSLHFPQHDILTNQSNKTTHIKEGKAELFKYTHPDPYCVPFMPGGSLFMRNPPPPMSICFPDGNLPDDAPRYTLNPDMSICKAETGKSAVGNVLVDFGKKNME